MPTNALITSSVKNAYDSIGDRNINMPEKLNRIFNLFKKIHPNFFICQIIILFVMFVTKQTNYRGKDRNYLWIFQTFWRLFVKISPCTSFSRDDNAEVKASSPILLLSTREKVVCGADWSALHRGAPLPSSFFPLPSSFFHLPSSFFHLPSL